MQRLETRREFLRSPCNALGTAALWTLLKEDGRTLCLGSETNADSVLRKAKSVIYLHMIGAPSQLDLFEDKPLLVKRNGEICPDSLLQGKRFAFIGGSLRLAGSRYRFQRAGQAGHCFSELLPHLSSVADDLTFIHSMHTDEINHAPAQMYLHSGFGRGGRPSLGAWVSYGLGSLNNDLPNYIVLLSGPTGGAGSNLWSPGFLPTIHQGTPFRSKGDPVLYLSNPTNRDETEQRQIIDVVRELNHDQWSITGDAEIATRIEQYELAFRMQMSVPELMDLNSESKETLDLYGAEPRGASFANNCLLARRLVERGVRFVQLFDADWDHHGDLEKRLPAKCKDIDRACAALILDLKRRGLLEETLVVWGSEFGRTPLAQNATGEGVQTKLGRDHHKDAFTMWLAGAGVKPGVSYGASDEFGFDAVENPVHVHDWNATLLHLLGIDHEKLTYRYQGRNYRLTDVHGQVIEPIL